MPRLLIKKAAGNPADVSLSEASYTLGRSPDNAIVLEGSGVSRHHAVLRREGEGFLIEDLGSHNGVFVNNVRVQQAALKDRDQIRISNHILIFDLTGRADALLSSAPTISIEEDYEQLVADLRSKAAPATAPDETCFRSTQKERQTLGLLYDLGRALSSVQSLDDVSRLAVQILLETTPAERGAVFLLEEDGKTLRPAMVCVRDGVDSRLGPVALSSTVAQRILSERIGIITADAASDPRFAHGKSIEGLRSIACAPLIGKAGNLGILYVENNHSVGAFANDDLKLLCAVASQVGLSVENARFFEALKQSNEELERLVKERTAALRQTELKLYRSEKMASLSRLVAGVTHEINNPLGALKGNLELLMALFGRLATTGNRSQDETNLLKHMLGIAHDSVSACARILGVVRSLSSFARLDQAAFKLASVNEGLSAAVQLLEPSARGRVEVIMNLGDVSLIPCYPALLNEAFMNMLNNACDAIKKTGQVFIDTRCEGGEVIVSIRDTGSGIPRELQDKIFDPGFTTKGVGVGIGMGLAVAYSVIREHHGSIEVDSEVGRGSTFTIRLPVATVEPAHLPADTRG